MMSQDRTVRILIVEDTLSLLKLYGHVLRQAGHQVEEATSGAQARAMLQERPPDIVLLDRVLPDIDGSEICAWIKDRPESANIYVIMLSALRTTEDDRVSGLEAGADDYIVKPVSRRELLARIKVAARLTRAQQALQASEAKHRSLAENSPDVIMRLDPHGQPTYVNQRIETILGLSPDAFLSRVGGSLEIDPSLATAWRTACAEVVATRKPRHFEFSYNVCGDTYFVDTRFVPEFDQDGEVISVLAVLRDLSERIRSERERELVLTVAAALRKATRRDEAVEIVIKQMMTLFSVAGASICTFDGETHQIVVEQAVGDFAATTGRCFNDVGSLAEKLQSSGDLLVFDDPTQPIPAALGDLLPGARACVGVPLTQEGQNLGIMWVSSAASIPDQVVRLLGAIADMVANTLQRVRLFDEMERYAADLEARVAERTHELAEANKRLLELDRLKSKFVSNVSHELRTPISNLKLYLSLLQRGKQDKRAHYEAMLKTSAERLGQLVEDILNLSRLEISHYQPREMEPTDLNAVINQVVALHQPQAESAGLRLIFDADRELPLIFGDYNQLSQLVTNLVVNALHYTPRGRVAVKTGRLQTDAAILLSVEDTGVGIMPEDLPHVFDRFYRGNHRQGVDIPGTGLGLAIVKEIVEIHHGEISLQSQIDIGTRVEVRLPVTSAPPSALD